MVHLKEKIYYRIGFFIFLVICALHRKYMWWKVIAWQRFAEKTVRKNHVLQVPFCASLPTEKEYRSIIPIQRVGVTGGRSRGGSLYGDVQCSKGNGHMGAPHLRWTDRHDWKHYLPATYLAGGNKEKITITYKLIHPSSKYIKRF